jgi:hypothetical protein
MKKHYNLTSVLHYLKTFHKKPKEVSGPHDKLNRGSLYEWFTPRREIKPHLKKCHTKKDNFSSIKDTFFNSGNKTKIEK